MKKTPAQIRRHYWETGKLVFEWLIKRLGCLKEEEYPDYYIDFVGKLSLKLQQDLERERNR